MTIAEFRTIALSLPEAVESSHVGHPDFRIGTRGKIFATLGYPNDDFGVLVLTPDQQQELIGRYPDMFEPVKGGWGKRGNTQVVLAAAKRHVIESAMRNAWLNVGRKRQRQN
jgi:hypothetical protein